MLLTYVLLEGCGSGADKSIGAAAFAGDPTTYARRQVFNSMTGTL